jgi:hypothetical protein
VSSDNCIKCSFTVTLQILIKMHNESVLLAHSFTHSLIHSFTQSLSHSVTHLVSDFSHIMEAIQIQTVHINTTHYKQ